MREADQSNGTHPTISDSDADRAQLALADIVDAAIEISGADFGDIQLLDARTGDLRIAAQRGFSPAWLAFWNSVAKGQGACGSALERGARILVEDIEQSPIFVGTPGLEVQRREGVRAIQSTPVVSRAGKPLGLFSTHYRTPGRPDESTLRLLDFLARQAAEIIEHARDQEALLASELRYRSLVQATSAVTWTCPPMGRHVKPQPSWMAFTGQSADEMLGSGWTKAIHPEDLATVSQQWDDAVAEGKPFVSEHRIRRHDGQWRWMSVSAVPIQNSRGDVLEWFGMSLDVTERKEADNASIG